MSPLAPFTFLRAAAIDAVDLLGGIGLLLRDTAASARQALFGKRGRRISWANLWEQMVRVGVKSIPIVSLVVFCIGAILALQMAPILRDYGQVDKVANVIGVAIFRELGPLMAAIVLSGYAGASIAAEIGAMVVSEEIEAMETMAISPIRFLVLPRVLATTIMLVCLSVLADLMGMLGGLVIANLFLHIEPIKYLHNTFQPLKLTDFFTGLIKAGVFGVIISSLACYLGLGVKGGATGVGQATTRTVVLTIVSLIAVDLLFTAAFYFLEL